MTRLGRARIASVAGAFLVACSSSSADEAATDPEVAPGPRDPDGGSDAGDARRDDPVAPIPAIDPEPAAPCAASTASSDHYQFLDDVCSAKRLPKDRARDFACPVTALSGEAARPDGTPIHYLTSSDPVVFDDALPGLAPASVSVTLILIRRVNGVPRYRYVSNGTQEQRFQPGSSSKFMAAANAAATLRKKSNGKVGLTARTGSIPLGDLVTTAVSYDESHGYTSNGVGRYFHDIGGRARAGDLVHGAWLKRPAEETFGGNYGAPSPALSYTFVDGAATVSVTPDATMGPANLLSTHTIAEFLKRLAMHREDAAQRLPGIQEADIETLFYGASSSPWFPGTMGGMSDDTAIYVQAGHDISYLDARSQGRWRIFSKLGFGDGDFVHAAYACLPVLNGAGAPVPDVGRELVIVTRVQTGAATERERDRMLARTYRTILPAVIDGRVP
ncbi:hypothetical protein BH11MYX4_BH11MYX4_27920 [soil metagenome]